MVGVWDDLSGYLVSDMGAIERSPRMLELRINFEDQSVVTYVSSAIGPSEKLWVSIDALVAPMNGIDLGSAARAVGDVVCGGLAHIGIRGTDYLAVRHGMPIHDLPPERINDFLEPLYAASYSALSLKQQLDSPSAAGGFNRL